VPYSWDRVEETIGSRVPNDYKGLLGHSGSIVVDEWLLLFGPEPNNGNDLATIVIEREHAWTTLREAGFELPTRFFVASSRLIAFAAIESNYFFWHARNGVPPEEWATVIVDADLDAWYEFDVSATECIYKILVGEIQLDPFENLFEVSEHRVRPFSN
jgi:hypothetical protein